MKSLKAVLPRAGRKLLFAFAIGLAAYGLSSGPTPGLLSQAHADGGWDYGGGPAYGWSIAGDAEGGYYWSYIPYPWEYFEWSGGYGG